MILAQGPLFKQRMTIAYREVLRSQENGGFVVHRQYFPEFPSLEKYHFGDGSYFGRLYLAEAMKRFAERVEKHADYVAAIEGEYP